MKGIILIAVVISDITTVLGLTGGCCPEDALYDMKSKKCRYPSTNVSMSMLITCDDANQFVNGSYNMTFNVEPNGRVMLQINTYRVILNAEEDCLTTNENNEAVLVFCFKPEIEIGVGENIRVFLFILSGICFAITTLVYALLPELRDLQGKIIASLCGSSCLGWCFMASLHMEYSNMNLCAVRGFVSYFFMMSSFFWMNALSIQVYRSIKSPNSNASENREFLFYSLYAWGCSAALLTCALLANYLPGSEIPGFGYNICWFSGSMEIWLYFYGPLGVILVGNSALFACSILLIWRQPRASSRARALAYKVWMTTRLFVVVGVMWVFELVSSIHGQHHILWVIADIYNLLQGVMVLTLLVVLRQRVIKAFAKRGLLCHSLINISDALVSHDLEDENIVENDVDEATVEVPLDKS